MSVKVMNWVWERSRATGGDLLVLLAIADHSGDDGSDAFPLVGSLAGKCRMSPRSIQRAVSRLTDLGELRVERNQGGLAGTPVDRRPNRYTVVMDPAGERGDRLSPREFAPEMAARGDDLSSRRPVENPERGDRRDTRGVTCVTERDDIPVTHNRPGTIPEPPPPLAAASPVGGDLEGGGGARRDSGEFFDALATGWLLSSGQRRRLMPRIREALAAGWDPGELAAYVGANTAGVRNAYAVLHARLGDLPDPPNRAPSATRPPWCGVCVEATRMCEDADGRPWRCPRCHPGAARDQLMNTV